MPDHSFTFDFVISYAGEDQKHADRLNQLLKAQGATVFYAPDFPEKTWGTNLYECLSDIYSNKGLFCIPLVSKDYVRKQWTRHEWQSAQARALEEAHKEYILPVRIDDTELPGLLKTTGYLALGEFSIQEIAEIAIQKLRAYVDVQPPVTSRAPQSTTVEPWQYVTSPDQRSSFLAENNYGDRQNEDFAANQWTRNLLDLDNPDQSARAFVSFVSIPVPEPIMMDLEQVEHLLGFEQLGGVRSGEQEGPEYWFVTMDLAGSRYSQSESVRFGYWARSQSERYLRFLRWTEIGAIEYGVSNPAARIIDHGITGADTKAFHFVYIVGTAWRFMNFAASIYSRIGYQGQFQFLLNIKGTSNAALGEFAMSPSSQWPSLLTSHSSVAQDWARQGIGRAIDPNVQLVFTIDIPSLVETPSISADIMREISHKIQRSFNYKVEPRHFIRGTDEFPWNQYHEEVRHFL